jgi:hypothetical protein
VSKLSLKSSKSDAAVELSDVDGDSFRVSVVARDHSASRIVYGYTDAFGVPALFAQAAQEWRGWDGRKVWQSIEGELQLALSHDRRGHVTLGIRLRSNPGGADSWQQEAEIGLDSGQLEAIALSARTLWGAGG